MGVGEADWRRHIGIRIKRRRALVSVCRETVCEVLLGYSVTSHVEVGEIGVNVDRWGLRRLGGGWKYTKGREI